MLLYVAVPNACDVVVQLYVDPREWDILDARDECDLRIAHRHSGLVVDGTDRPVPKNALYRFAVEVTLAQLVDAFGDVRLLHRRRVP